MQRNPGADPCTCESVRYNPCFSGSSSATQYLEEQERLEAEVTILVFLAALVQLKTYRKKGRQKSSRYNPCFSGSSSATYGLPNIITAFVIVTILVFLAALVQRQGSITPANLLIFEVTILVFLAALVQRKTT